MKDSYRILPCHTKSELAALKASIEADGLQDSIIIDTENRVIDGHARRDICEELGIDWLAAADVRSGMSDDEKKALAISLNLARRSSQPTQQQRREYANTFLLANAEMSDGAIGQIVGLSQQCINNYRRELTKDGKLQVVQATVGKDGSRRKITRRKGARLIVKGKAEYAKCAPILEEMKDEAEGLIRHPDRLRKKYAQKLAAEEVANSKLGNLPSQLDIHCCDFRNLPVDPSTVDLLLTDVEWGIGKEEDWSGLAALAKTWLKPNGIFASYIGQMHLAQFLTSVTPHLCYQWTFAVLYDQTTRNHARSVIEGWRPVVIFSRAAHADLGFVLDRMEGSGVAKQYHPWQQCLTTATTLISRLSRPGSVVVDPQIGSGTNAVACALLGDRRFIGGDIDPEAVKIAHHRVATEGQRTAA